MNKACRKMLKDIEQYERYENQFLDKENTTDELLEWILACYIDTNINLNKKSTIGSVQKIISSYANKGKSGY
jgi:hypothetical protein